MNPGVQLGPYRVESLIGAGGMGEVYLGVDTRLDRQVAIKMLPGRLAGDPSLRERFEREARTVSSLSHPNICTLFDLGHHEGNHFLVMEYLQGETLADRIARGALPSKETIRIGLAIAAALEAAHRQGIVHRDLKPGNVMLTKSGVKLLDFGLAKLSASATGVTSAVTFAATEQKPLTEQGTILGTFQYMAPEQLQGDPADARSDIFALGAILYEMATGRRAFEGTSKASLIAAIIEREPPPMTAIQPLTPPALERVVRACLAKDPGERIQTAHDVALQLQWMGDSSSLAEAVRVRRFRKAVPWVVAAVCATAAIAGMAGWWRERVKPPAPFTLGIPATQGHEMAVPVPSPDGKLLALAQVNRETREPSLWVRRVSDGSERQIVSGSIRALFWSPDSKWIGFRQEPDRLMRVSVDGGPPETICRCSVQTLSAWSDEGTILFNRAFGEGLMQVPAIGGEPLSATTLDASRLESVHATPLFLPGERRFLYVSHTIAENRNEIWLASLDGGKPARVMAADALVGYSKPYILFVRNGSVYAQRFDSKAARLSGEPRRVVDRVPFSESDVLAFALVSRAGPLAYARFVNIRTRLNIYDRNGAISGILWEGDDLGLPQLSSDETSLVVTKADGAKGANDIYVVDLVRKVSTRVTTGLSMNSAPRLSPDGQSVAFQSDRGGMFDIYVQAADGSSPARILWKDAADKGVGDWSPDGKYVIATRFTPASRNDLWVVPVDGRKPWPWVATENSESEPRFSPDGKWVAYLVGPAGEADLYVRPFPEGRALRVSSDGAASVSWSPDGRELVWSTRGRIMTAAIDLSSGSPRIGTPTQLFWLPRVWSSPIPMKDGRIAILGPAPGQEESETYFLTTAWRSQME